MASPASSRGYLREWVTVGLPRGSRDPLEQTHTLVLLCLLEEVGNTDLGGVVFDFGIQSEDRAAILPWRLPDLRSGADRGGTLSLFVQKAPSFIYLNWRKPVIVISALRFTDDN